MPWCFFGLLYITLHFFFSNEISQKICILITAHCLGIAEVSKIDKIPYTTLSYSTGGRNNVAYKVVNNESVRINPNESDTRKFTYSQQAAIITDEAHHGGGDVAVYALG